MRIQWIGLIAAIAILSVLSAPSIATRAQSLQSTDDIHTTKNMVRPAWPRRQAAGIVVQDMFGVSKSARYALYAGDFYAAYGYAPPSFAKASAISRLRQMKAFMQQKRRVKVDEVIADIERSLSPSWWIDSWHLSEKRVEETKTDDTDLNLAGVLGEPPPVKTQSREKSAFVQSKRYQKNAFPSLTTHAPGLSSKTKPPKEQSAKTDVTRSRVPAESKLASTERHGEEAFSQKALSRIQKLLNKAEFPTELTNELMCVADDLLEADRVLAQVKITEAELSGGDKEELFSAHDEMEKTKEYDKTSKYGKAPLQYRRAWLHAVKAEKIDCSDEPGHLQVATLGGGLPVSALGRPYPNPSGTGAIVRYGLAQQCRVTLKVYDTTGRLVRILVDGEQGPGHHACEWDGKSAQGEEVGSGIYYYHFTAGPFTASRKVVILK